MANNKLLLIVISQRKVDQNIVTKQISRDKKVIGSKEMKKRKLPRESAEEKESR